MIGMARMLNKHGWNALAWNYRGCSGEVNRQFRMYHNGSIDDLEVVIKHVGKKSTYQIIALIGFSLGGNLTLVYLGTRKDSLDPRIRKAVTFSVPCDLAEGARELVKRKNWFYMRQFLVSLHDKIKRKMAVLPGEIDDDGYAAIRNFKDFDDRYTAPIDGFKDAEDYWTKCSNGPFIPEIRIPALIVNALDDPLLAEDRYPAEKAQQSTSVPLEMPGSRGHVGFVQFNNDGSHWSEARTLEFMEHD
jgi:predicted alpha/beta-fold hydrolase